MLSLFNIKGGTKQPKLTFYPLTLTFNHNSSKQRYFNHLQYKNKEKLTKNTTKIKIIKIKTKLKTMN
ncbi:hypothetical protein CCZ37_00715 [Vibrio qinghaiensis]|uniref:Uncharacterized protein n=1 Tax=Vibrio qinghaiensis TaxID=2025808 RepID=A0A223MUP8_9VIBR|nr:hypothetical protein CCZ37_00715 [Vibrio qinghaiensis]